MRFSEIGAARWLAAMLLVTVATQVFYIGVVSPAGDDTPLRPATWMVEAAAFTIIAVAGIALAARAETAALAWSALALSGIVNLVQLGIGLAMFGPAQAASDTLPELLEAVLAGAFFFYFLGKVLIGLAAIGFGLAALRVTGIGKVLGALAALAGAVAIAINVLAMATGMSWTFAAGAAGTVATALLGALLLVPPRRAVSDV